MWYTITVKTEDGAGDYGSNHKVVFDGKSKKKDIVESVSRLKLAGFSVLVFAGKGVGKLVEI